MRNTGTELRLIAVGTYCHYNYKGEENVVWSKPVTDEEYKEVNQQ